MGGSIARRLLSEGFEVHGYDPAAGTPGLEDLGLRRHPTLSALAAEIDTVVLSLPDGSFSERVCLGADGLLAGEDSHIICILDTTTTRPREAEHLAAETAERGVDYFDVGLSGSSHMVSEGRGLAAIAGPEAASPTTRALFAALCEDVVEVGGPGDGMRMKLVINMVLGLNRLAMAEALTMGEKMGMDTSSLLEVLKLSAAASKAMTIWGERMVEGDFGQPTSRIRQHVKDVRQMLELGEEYGLPMLGASQLALVARVGMAAGWADLDNAAQIESIRRMSGLPPRTP
jgi:3-hydroxyisobutyrate dehydrogenase-like beta-hydroxyacid dehydrogenase